MKFCDRVKQLGLPSKEVIVIGSGLLDALGLRLADDVDLVVSERLFDELLDLGGYEVGEKEGDTYLFKNGVEIWRDWGYSFEDLMKTVVEIDNVLFMDPQILIEKKRARGLEKDLRDIALLEEYYVKK